MHEGKNMMDPMIIQGGMGVAVSNWNLARAVSLQGHLGVVSGTGIDTVLIRRLQIGDPDGLMRHALNHFPFPEIAQQIIDTYFIPGGKTVKNFFKRLPMFSANAQDFRQQIAVAANFVEIFLAKENHKGVVGLNLLEKIQIPNLASIYGAMLAGVDYLLMGAGIPIEIPEVLEKFVTHQKASLKLQVQNAQKEFSIFFEPLKLFAKKIPELKKPKFLAIISSFILAKTLVKRTQNRVDGFILEGPIAGGHNAPPRGQLCLNSNGEPVYTDKDQIDVDKIKALNVPFWMAGGYNSPEKLKQALSMGAKGIQVGTLFAFCEESGFLPEIKTKVIEKAKNNTLRIKTDPHVSPTGFPFKVIQIENTMSDPSVDRPMQCDLGYLRHLYQTDEGTLGYRCPAEKPQDYIKKGGTIEETEGKGCLCNSLIAGIGLAQLQKNGDLEKPLVTASQDFDFLPHILKGTQNSYHADDVIEYLLDMKKDPA